MLFCLEFEAAWALSMGMERRGIRMRPTTRAP
jgi:hypothetical protein